MSERATFGQRLVAYLVDRAILAAGFVVVAIIAALVGTVGVVTTVVGVAESNAGAFGELEAEMAVTLTQAEAERLEAEIRREMEKRFADGPAAYAEFLDDPDAFVQDAVNIVFDGFKRAEVEGASADEIDALRARIIDIVGRAELTTSVRRAAGFLKVIASIPFILVLLYFLSEAISGVTIGKLIQRLKVGTTDAEFESRAPLITRYAIKMSPTIIGLVGVATLNFDFLRIAGILGLLVFLGSLVALGPKRQALHDIPAATAVYRTES